MTKKLVATRGLEGKLKAKIDANKDEKVRKTFYLTKRNFDAFQDWCESNNTNVSSALDDLIELFLEERH